MANVHVGVQLRREPAELVPADAVDAAWAVEVEVVPTGAGVDFRGPAVQGRRGERFIYLTWGDVGPNQEFEMFRRAKLMLDRVDQQLIARAVDAGRLAVTVDLTDERGGPRCARVDPPAIAWSVPTTDGRVARPRRRAAVP